MTFAQTKTPLDDFSFCDRSEISPQIISHSECGRCSFSEASAVAVTKTVKRNHFCEFLNDIVQPTECPIFLILFRKTRHFVLRKIITLIHIHCSYESTHSNEYLGKDHCFNGYSNGLLSSLPKDYFNIKVVDPHKVLLYVPSHLSSEP